jgi:hypothetical protein
MVGFQADNLFGYERTSISFYDGPSYALDPPYKSIGYKHREYLSTRKKYLNAIAVEFTFGLPFTKKLRLDAALLSPLGRIRPLFRRLRRRPVGRIGSEISLLDGQPSQTGSSGERETSE